jgi:hypothetical protein
LIGFDVTNKGSVTGTPSCSINAASIPSENVPMKPITSGQILITPLVPFQVPNEQGAETKVTVTCSTHAKPTRRSTGNPSYTVTNITASRVGVNKTLLNVNFQVRNTGTAAGTPHCEASFRYGSQWYKAGAPQPVGLQAFGDALYMKQLDPGVVEFVKGFDLVVSNAQSATARDVNASCH